MGGSPEKRGGRQRNGNGKPLDPAEPPTSPAVPPSEPPAIVEAILDEHPKRCDLALFERALREGWPMPELADELALAVVKRMFSIALDPKSDANYASRAGRILDRMKRTNLEAIKIATGQAGGGGGVNVNVGVGVSAGGATVQEVAAELEKDPRFVEFARRLAVEGETPKANGERKA